MQCIKKPIIEDSSITYTTAQPSSTNKCPIEILKRPNPIQNLPRHINLFPLRHYHQRLSEYIRKRQEIFEIAALSYNVFKPTRSTLRLRLYYKRRKVTSKYLISSISCNSTDKRLYAKVSFLNFEEHGLLDTGANVTCIGSDLALHNFSKFNEFKVFKSSVKTADGQLQKVLGFLDVHVCFKNLVKKLRILIVPTLSQRLILGLDFWREFNLAPSVFESIVISSPSENNKMSDITSLSALNSDFSSVPNSVLSVKNEIVQQYPLTPSETLQLEAVKALFPNFEKHGLGRTSLIKHEIDVSDAKPIKQRFYPVSPAVEQLMYQEIDRMLSLGVIEPSTSPWSSPMRLVVKPNKVRLCLDEEKLIAVTKKTYNTYPA